MVACCCDWIVLPTVVTVGCWCCAISFGSGIVAERVGGGVAVAAVAAVAVVVLALDVVENCWLGVDFLWLLN